MPSVLAMYMGEKRTPGGCELYRVVIPFHYMKKTPIWKAGWMSYQEFLENFLKHGPDYIFWVGKQVDLFVFPRTMFSSERSRQAVQDIFDIVHLMGRHIVYEVDDDFSNEHRHVVDGDAMTVASWADAITVTTPYLAEKMTRLTGLPSYVLPNMLDPEVWCKGENKRKIDKDQVIIGLTGSATHNGDWKVLADVLPRILKEYPQAYLALGGFHPDYLKNLPNTEYLPVLPYEIYADLIRSCDIILAPIDPSDGFNMGKSPVKCLEGQGAHRLIDQTPAGAAVIATDHPIYRLAVRNGETGLLVQHTPEDWYAAIKSLIEDATLRRKLQMAGYRWAWKHHDASRQWTEWAKAYRAILKQPSLAFKENPQCPFPQQASFGASRPNPPK